MARNWRKAKRMSSSNFLTDPRLILVADASVVINLNATGGARAIITAFPNKWAVTANAFSELIGGQRNGHDDAHALQALIKDGVIDLVGLGAEGGRVYETLIDGTAFRTLDDGEAATIAYAHEVRGVALIDERKATNLCADRYPDLPLLSTVELLLHDVVVRALGQNGHVGAILGALQKARMRVPPDQISRVVEVIGKKCAAKCMSLPKGARVSS
jgi:predicted nucleic acid-binding protein